MPSLLLPPLLLPLLPLLARRYAQALIDREIAILELAEVMGQHEAEVAERELAAAADALAAARAEAADAEAEAARAAADGPVAHRKRDLLDKVNKEAEHRELVAALAVRGAAARERIAAEEVADAAARARREAALAALAEVSRRQTGCRWRPWNRALGCVAQSQAAELRVPRPQPCPRRLPAWPR